MLELGRERAAGFVTEQMCNEVERLRRVAGLVVDDPAELELTDVAELLQAATSALLCSTRAHKMTLSCIAGVSMSLVQLWAAIARFGTSLNHLLTMAARSSSE